MTPKGIILEIINAAGYELRRKRHIFPSFKTIDILNTNIRNIHYGCGNIMLKDWINIDQFNDTFPTYISTDLANHHPFPDNYFEFGYSEDFIEHLTQDESIIFLAEAFRTLKPSGVLRLSFPSLEKALKLNYPDAFQLQKESFFKWEHKHFYTKEEIETVAKNIGFYYIEFMQYKKSSYPALTNLDQKETENIYVELTKGA